MLPVSSPNNLEKGLQNLGKLVEEKLDSLDQRIRKLERNLYSGNHEARPFSNLSMNDSEKSENIAVFGGGYNWKPSSDIYLFDLKRKISRKIALKTPYPTISQGTAFLNGEVYLFGGSNDSFALNHLYKLSYDFKWKKLASMRWSFHCSHISFTSVVLDGCIWVVEGEGKCLLKYEPKVDVWIDMPEMIEFRKHPGVAVVNSTIFVCGGEDSKTIESFDPMTNSWRIFAEMPEERFFAAAVGHGSYLYLLGGSHKVGEGNVSTKTVWRINVEEGDAKWEEMPPLNNERTAFAAVSVGDMLATIGGSGSEVFNGKEWIIGPGFTGPREQKAQHSSIVIPEEFGTYLSSFSDLLQD